MTEDEHLMLQKIRTFIIDHPERFTDAIFAITSGLKTKLQSETDRATDIEVCFMNYLTMNHLPGQPHITYKSVAEKLKEVKGQMRFSWDHIIEMMENEPEELGKLLNQAQKNKKIDKKEKR